MTTTAPSTALVMIQPAFTGAERLALAGFLDGYRGLTREAYALDQRQFTTWCRARSLALFVVRRADIESFARELEARGRARATVTRRLCTIAGFYRYAVEEELAVSRHLLTRAARRGDTQRVALVRDALRLLGVLVACPVSRRPVRPPADEAMRSLPGDGLGNGGVPGAARIVPGFQRVQAGGIFAMTPKAQDRCAVRVAGPGRALVPGGDAGQMSWVLVLEPAGEMSTRLITRSRGTAGRVAPGLLLTVFWHPPDFGMRRRQLLTLRRLAGTA